MRDRLKGWEDDCGGSRSQVWCFFELAEQSCERVNVVLSASRLAWMDCLRVSQSLVARTNSYHSSVHDFDAALEITQSCSQSRLRSVENVGEPYFLYHETMVDLLNVADDNLL